VKVNTRSLLPALVITLVWLNCGDGANPVAVDLSDPSTLRGTYKLISITDKSGENLPEDVTIVADQPTTVDLFGVPVTITISGTLKLTDTRFTLTVTLKMSVPGLPEQTETETATGTYSINGSTFTITSDDPEVGTLVYTITAQGLQIILENDEERLVFEKQ